MKFDNLHDLEIDFSRSEEKHCSFSFPKLTTLRVFNYTSSRPLDTTALMELDDLGIRNAVVPEIRVSSPLQFRLAIIHATGDNEEIKLSLEAERLLELRLYNVSVSELSNLSFGKLFFMAVQNCPRLRKIHNNSLAVRELLVLDSN